MYPSGASNLPTDGPRDEELRHTAPRGQPPRTEPVSTIQAITGIRHDADTIFRPFSLEITDRLKPRMKETRFFDILAQFTC